MEKENNRLEYKENISKTYLKTVSAFANYNDGKIIFGVTDDMRIVGIENPDQACLDIENQINDSIKPRPDYSLKVNNDNTITLCISKGTSTPYRYNGKTYKRNNTSTIEVDSVEENRLILSGINLTFEELNIEEKELHFDYLKEKLTKVLMLNSFNLDTLKSLSLYDSKHGYNNAAKLLSDNNDFPGIDIVVFGDSINVIKKRYSFSNESIVKQYYDALDVFNNEYTYEKIEGGFRKKEELIPMEAFREALANAIVHRAWDIKANTKIEMYANKIIVSSPGGLSDNMSKEDYIKGNYSYLRNPIIANVFRRLNIIEAFATGIKRIINSYKDSILKPVFDVTSGAISITLPLFNQANITANEQKVLNSLKENYMYSRLEIENATGLSKDTLLRALNSLTNKGLIIKTGQAKSTLYTKK